LRAPDHLRLERRLTAILAADVVGYSRLVSADEEGTHLRLLAYRRDVCVFRSNVITDSGGR
jgi:class 3 adenylate cyclase